MAKDRKKPKPEPAQAIAAPKIHEATRGNTGSVRKGPEITQSQAEARRKAGLDIVVCGPDRVANRTLAGLIERNANGKAKCCFPHLSAGSRSLPHWQPDPRPPEGHSFYETDNLKAT
jgi:hypothetical protein